jgi:hypothetical protein
MGYITQTKDYWIAPNAVTITPNALGHANRIQGSVASGAVISCYVEAVKPGGDNGDGLQLDNGRNPKRWPLSLSPTYFNSDAAKYVYAAIPRSASIGSQAVVVFPSEKIDIYGKNASDVQIGSTDYFYIFLQGIISEVYTDTSDNRQKRRMTHACDWGTLGTYEDLVKVKDSEWYSYDQTTQVVTLLKNLLMADGSKFQNLKAVFAEIDNYLQLNGDRLTGVAVSPDDDEASDKIVTPAYLDEFGNTRYLSKQHADTAQGLITFLDGLKVGGSRWGIDARGVAALLDMVFSGVVRSEGARVGFLDGTGILMDAGKGMIETDTLNVRRVMRVWELVFNQLQIMHRDYSFTEGAVVERVEPMGNGLYRYHVQSQYDGYVVPMKEGDVIYGIVNNLLEKKVTGANGTAPDYYYTWARIIENGVDLANGTLTVQMYPGSKVPGGQNFTPQGLSVGSAEQQAESDAYDTTLNITVHGNWLYDVVDGVKTARYPDRQTAWVLSATDRRLVMYQGVDSPIVADSNYALVLGRVPGLANLPQFDPDKPALYVGDLYYENMFHVSYAVPPEYRVADMGEWTEQLAGRVSKTAQGWTDSAGRVRVRPETATEVTGARNGLVYYDDGSAQYLTWQVTYMGMKWLCVEDGTREPPSFGSTAWQCVGVLQELALNFFTDDDPPLPLTVVQVRTTGVDFTVVPYVTAGNYDVTDDVVTAWQWRRESFNGGSDAQWNAGAKTSQRTLHVTDADLPTAWGRGKQLAFVCTATLAVAGGSETIVNRVKF